MGVCFRGFLSHFVFIDVFQVDRRDKDRDKCRDKGGTRCEKAGQHQQKARREAGQLDPICGVEMLRAGVRSTR